VNRTLHSIDLENTRLTTGDCTILADGLLCNEVVTGAWVCVCVCVCVCARTHARTHACTPTHTHTTTHTHTHTHTHTLPHTHTHTHTPAAVRLDNNPLGDDTRLILRALQRKSNPVQYAAHNLSLSEANFGSNISRLFQVHKRGQLRVRQREECGVVQCG